MSEQKIENAILNSIDILTQQALNKAGFDKTIQATIKRCENKALGQYMVKYQDSQFYAYSASPETTYSTNTLVYVLVPNGDFKKDKTIIGAVSKLSTDYITPIDENSFDLIGSNFVTTNGQFALKSWNNQPQELEKVLYPNNPDFELIDAAAIEEYMKESNYLHLRALVQTKLDKEQIHADYAFEVIMKFLDNSGEEVYRKYTLGVNQMIGNPYELSNPTPQSFIYEIDGANFLSIEKIALVQKGFNKDVALEDIDDIFFSNISIQCAEPLVFSEDGRLGLSVTAARGTIITLDKSTNEPNPSTIDFTAFVKAKGAVYTSKVDYMWFIEDARVDASSTRYSNKAGVGWKQIDTVVANKLSIESKDVLARTIRYKCVATVDNVVLSKIVRVYNLDSEYELSIETDGGTEFYYDKGEYYLKATLLHLHNDITEDSTNGVHYSWYSMDNKGFYAIEDDEYGFEYELGSDDVNNNGEMEHILYARDIIGFKKYFCHAYDSHNNLIGTAEITITNALEGGGYSLVIKNGTKLYKYNEKGISPASHSMKKPVEIPALYFEIYSPEGDLEYDSQEENKLNGISVTWMMPSDDTLLVFNEDNDKDEDGNLLNKIHREENDYYISENLAQYLYKIRNNYKAAASRNNIELIVNYKGNVLSTTTNFTFTKEGNNGTNGTDYSAKIIEVGRENRNGRIYINYAIQIYRDGELLLDTDNTYLNCTWRILTNSSKETNQFRIEDVSQTYPKYIKSKTLTISYPEDAILEQATTDILQAEVYYTTDGDTTGRLTYTIYAFEPIHRIKIGENYIGWSIRLKNNTGFDEVIYDPDGTKPSYDNDNPFELELFDANSDLVDTTNYHLEWTTVGEIFSTVAKAMIPDNMLKINKIVEQTADIKVANQYNGSVTSAVCCGIFTDNTYTELIAAIKIPIYMGINRYSNSALNGWNGNSIEINNDGAYILAPQIGAGYKNNDNSFTGVVMGTQENTSDHAGTGLFGFGAGEVKFFLNAETGNLFAKSATIEGRIEASSGNIGEWIIEPAIYQGTTYKSGGYLRNRTGTIWLHPLGTSRTPSNQEAKVNGEALNWVFYSNGNFGVDTRGYLYATLGKIGPWLMDSQKLYANIRDAIAEVRPEKISTLLFTGSTYRGIALYANNHTALLSILGSSTDLKGGLVVSNNAFTDTNGESIPSSRIQVTPVDIFKPAYKEGVFASIGALWKILKGIKQAMNDQLYWGYSSDFGWYDKFPDALNTYESGGYITGG